jgi:hypothetical protein
MPFFTFRKIFRPDDRVRSPGEHFLRVMLLITVFVGIGWLYTQHFDATIKEIESRGAVYDETGTLTKEQKQVFRAFVSEFKDEFGLELKLTATKESIVVPPMDSKTMFFGVNPERRQVVVEFPPLVEKALGKDFVHSLVIEHFPASFDEKNWPRGLAEALNMVWERLISIESGAES